MKLAFATTASFILPSPRIPSNFIWLNIFLLSQPSRHLHPLFLPQSRWSASRQRNRSSGKRDLQRRRPQPILKQIGCQFHSRFLP
jgi:hypothetical protein